IPADVAQRLAMDAAARLRPPQSNPASYRPPPYRASMFRVIPRASESHFLAAAEPLLHAYAEYSEAGGPDRAARVLHLSLDLPSHALMRASRRRPQQHVAMLLGWAQKELATQLNAIRARADTAARGVEAVAEAEAPADGAAPMDCSSSLTSAPAAP